MRRAILLVCAAAGAAAAVVLLLRGGGGEHALRPGRPVVATTSLTPRLSLFADPLTAELRVAVDSSRVDPGSVRIHARFAPYRLLRAMGRTERREGGSTLISYRFVLRCLSAACLPKERLRVFPPTQVVYRVRDSSVEAGLNAPWPQFLVASRLNAVDLARPRMHQGLHPLPRLTYTMPPDQLASVLGAAAVALLLGAAGLVVKTRPRLAPAAIPQANGALSPLEAALALVRQAAANGDPQMQRKALERLASELRRSRLPGLARAARRLAWSEPDPVAETTGTLADEVVRAVRESG